MPLETPEPTSTPAPSLHPLTPRERQIVQLYAQGKRPQEIAQDLSLAPSTIEDYVGKIYRKLGVGDVVGMLSTCVRHGLIRNTYSSTPLERPLSRRERQVLSLRLNGFNRVQTATKMRITIRGVDYHVGNCRQKLGAQDCAEAVMRALAIGAIQYKDSK